MTRDEIKDILPHREPMLLLDEVSRDGQTARGSYRVSGEEWFLKGHFPGNPVVPGVILCEIMAQSACVLLPVDHESKKTPYFTGLNNVKIKNSVRPGDLFETECVITKSREPFYFASAKGFVGEKLCIIGDFSFALIGG